MSEFGREIKIKIQQNSFRFQFSYLNDLLRLCPLEKDASLEYTVIV